MILIPISTDAPLYHRPIGTVSMIVLNVAAFVLTIADPETAFEKFGLNYGGGLQPLQWLTSNFMHAGIFHLIGNMIFLWGFGLIVEGKVGWYQFVPLYLGIGVTQCAIEQLIFMGSTGFSVGASSIIFGLMVIALIWAPRNELTVFYSFFIRFTGVYEISIVSFALLEISLALLMMVLAHSLGGYAASEVLHLMGAIIGGVIGFLYLKMKWVDCEGWDLLSVMNGRTPTAESYLSEQYREASQRRANRKVAERKRPSATEDVARTPLQLNQGSPERFAQLLSEKKAAAAFRELRSIRQRNMDWRPTLKQLLQLARGLRTARKMDDSVTVYQEFLEKRPAVSEARLELAELFVFIFERPSAAKSLLNGCNLSELTEEQRSRHARAADLAQRMIDSGVIEIQFQL